MPESQRATDFASQELTSDAFLSWKADLEDIMNGRPATSKIEELKNKITPGDPKYTAALQNLIPGEIKQKAAAALHWALTKPSENYSQIDQAFKLGTALTWVENGLTEKELLKMTKSVVPGTR